MEPVEGVLVEKVKSLAVTSNAEEDSLASCPSSGTDAAEPPNEEFSILHDFLPEHWPGILRYLSCSEFYAVSNASEKLRNSEGISREVTSRLLPLVLPILLRTVSGFGNQNIYTCLALNKFTKQALCDLLDDTYSSQTYWERITTSTHADWTDLHKNLQLCSNVIVDGQVQDFQTADRQKYAFLCRRLEVNFTDYSPETRRAILAPLVDYLQHHGHYVKILECRRLSCMSGAFLLLPFLPELVVLKLGTLSSVRRVFGYENAVNYPLLPHLETLDVRYANDLSVIKQFVEHYGKQIKTMNCNFMFFDAWNRDTYWYTENLENLERLSVSGEGDYGHVLKILKKQVLPKMQEIHLSNSNLKKGRVSIHDIQDIANGFESTLTSLYLNVHICNDEKEVVINEGSMSLVPKLTRVGTLLTNIRYSWFWQFVHRKCENLEELVFEHDIRMDSPLARVELHEKFQKLAFGILSKLKRIRIIYNVPIDMTERQPERIEITRNQKEWKILQINEK